MKHDMKRGRNIFRAYQKTWLITVFFLIMFTGSCLLNTETVYANSTITLEPGQTYDFSEKSSYKKYGALYVDIKKAGIYTLTGSASNTILRIDPKEGDVVTVKLNGVKLTPNDDAPGYYSDRAAIEIGDRGGTVILSATYNMHWDDGQEGNIFEGQGRMPAIRKDTTPTKLVFQAAGNDKKIIARADPKAFRTCAIGCYSKDAGVISRLYSNTTGNIYFESGTVYAYGSRDFTNGGKLGYDRWDGGAAIGAGSYGSVNGLTINGGNIYAYAGDTGCAAIGTSSSVDTGPHFSSALKCAKADNITINGGNITIGHAAVVGSKGATLSGMGAGIGGGYCSDVSNLVINGGNITVDSKYHYPYVGIGAGEEGDANYIEINGGNIDLEVKQVGIGTFATKETDILGSTAWLGDVRLKINGGDIKITSDKQCLGGGAPENKKSYVEINGGNLDLHSKAITPGPVIGPTCLKGKLMRITIHGGIINAHRDYLAENDERHAPIIGTPHYPNLSDHLSNNSIVEKIEITGGTVYLTEGSDKKPGKIGGNKGVDYNRDYTNVYISGGNIYANMLDDRVPLNRSGGKNLKCHKIKLNGDTHYSERDAANVIESQFTTKDDESYEYGIKDCRVFKNSPELWFWLPEHSEWGKIKTDFAPFSSLSATVFSGLVIDEKEFYIDENFYPPIYLNLIAGEAPDTQKDGSGMLLYADTGLSSFQPVDDSGWSKVIDSYNSTRSGGFPVLDRGGGFVNLAGSYMEDGRWVYIGANGTMDPALFDRNRGMDLYATVGDFDLSLKFDGNVPKKTESKLSGNMPPIGEYHDNDTVTLPTDNGLHPYYHFWLRGYTFKGWNTKADGTGKQYKSGQSGIPAGEFRKSSSDPSEVTLYAQWEPIKYKVRYLSTSVSVPNAIMLEYTYDTPAKPAWGDDLKDWGDQRMLLEGWQDEDDNVYGNNSVLLNYVDFNESGEPVAKTMYALWMEKGELRIRITTDGKGVSGLEDDIKLKNQYGSVPETRFEEDSDNQGTYVNVCETPLALRKETYSIEVGDRLLNPDEAIIEYDPDYAAFAELNSYTIKLNKAQYVNTVTIDPQDGTDDDGRPYVVAPIGYEINIDAQCNTDLGYIMDGWTCTGIAPEWDPSRTKQKIKVNGTAVLTPKVRGARYTVVFDPNDDARPGSEAATGSMDPQQFVVGETQKLSKATFKKKGYVQGGTLHGYWNVRPGSDPNGRFLWDMAEIGAVGSSSPPLSYTDGDTVTLYAQWDPLTFDVVYHDPSGTYQDGSQLCYYGNGINLPKLTTTGVIPGWAEREGYELYGWKARGISGEQVRKPGEWAVNLCTLNNDDTAAGYIMDAVWIEKGNIALDLTLDGDALSGKASAIRLTDGNRTYENYFTEDQSVAGRYIYKRSTGKDLPQGTYRVVVEGFEIPRTETFNYDPGNPADLKYDFFTVSVDKDDNIVSAQISTAGGTAADSLIALNGSQLTIDAAAEEGYHFDGWSWVEDKKPSDLDPGKAQQVVTVNDSAELTAHAAGNVYAVIFDPNDEAYPGSAPATGTMENQDMVYGEPQSLFNSGFDKTGYAFIGWNTKPDGSGEAYGNRKSVHNLTTEENGTVKLYAMWEPLEYTITYIDPYRLCKTQKQTVKYDETVSLLDADAEGWKPMGHSLHGWQGAALGSFYAPGQPVTNFCSVDEDGRLTGNVLYAEWVDEGNIRVSITLDDQGVDVDPDDIELVSEGDGTKYSGCFLKDSDIPGLYMFDPSGLGSGEDTAEDGLIPEGNYVVHLNNYDSYGLADAQVTIYYSAMVAASAHLVSDTVSVEAGEHVSSVKVKDPATGAEGDSVVVVNGAKAVVSADVDEEGYHFDSYAFSGTYPDMDPAEKDQEITVYGPVTLIAQASPNVYYIHFDANGGQGSRSDQPMTYDKENTLMANTFTRDHYYFRGWNTNADGSGVAYEDEAAVLNLASGEGDVVPLYAQWQKKPVYSITYDLNGGKLNGKTGKIVVQSDEGDVITIMDAPTRKGYTFDYWKGSEYHPGDEYLVEEDHTLTAMWTKDTSDTGGALVAKMTAKGKNKLVLKWNKFKGADGYDIFISRCNHNGRTITLKKVRSIKGNRTFKLVRRNLRKNTAYKAVVKAYVMKNGVKTYVKTSPVVHAYTRGWTKKYTNPKSVTVKKSKVTLKAGGTYKIKASVKKLKKGKKLMPSGHAPKLRYLSSDNTVAVVSKSGKVTAKSKGSCKIYAIAVNGVSKAINITVR